MAVCDHCNGEGVVCDECGTGDMPVRLTEYGELCQECVQQIIDAEEKEERELDG